MPPSLPTHADPPFAWPSKYTIVNWGNTTYLLEQYWPIVVFCVSAGVSAAICQAFLIVRVYKLTKQWAYPVVLGATACIAFAGTLFAGVETGLNSSYSNRAADDVSRAACDAPFPRHFSIRFADPCFSCRCLFT